MLSENQAKEIANAMCTPYGDISSAFGATNDMVREAAKAYPHVFSDAKINGFYKQTLGGGQSSCVSPAGSFSCAPAATPIEKKVSRVTIGVVAFTVVCGCLSTYYSSRPSKKVVSSPDQYEVVLAVVPKDDEKAVAPSQTAPIEQQSVAPAAPPAVPPVRTEAEKEAQYQQFLKEAPAREEAKRKMAIAEAARHGVILDAAQPKELTPRERNHLRQRGHNKTNIDTRDEKPRTPEKEKRQVNGTMRTVPSGKSQIGENVIPYNGPVGVDGWPTDYWNGQRPSGKAPSNTQQRQAAPTPRQSGGWPTTYNAPVAPSGVPATFASGIAPICG